MAVHAISSRGNGVDGLCSAVSFHGETARRNPVVAGLSAPLQGRIKLVSEPGLVRIACGICIGRVGFGSPSCSEGLLGRYGEHSTNQRPWAEDTDGASRTRAVAVSARPFVNAARMNVEHAASTIRCAVNTRPSTLTSQSVSDPSRHICVMTSLRDRAISSLATVSRGPAAGAAGAALVRFGAIVFT